MKIITVNVNGIRSACKKGFFDYLQQVGADIVCIQEIKAKEQQLDSQFYPKNYHSFYHSAQKKGYSGTAILSKIKPDKVIKSTNWHFIDDEARFIQADFANLSIISLYLPSGSTKEERQNLKMDFLNNNFMPYLKNIIKDGRKYIICGDWNIAHKKIDLKNWRSNQKNSGFLPEERAWMDELFYKTGFIDAFREVNTKKFQYTWWSNRGQAWANNTGWRIDYQILSANLKNTIKSASIYKDKRFSDHAPLIIEYKEPLNNHKWLI